MRFGEPGACDDSADLHLPMRGNDEQSLLRQTYYCSVHCGVAVYVPTVYALAVLPDIMGQAVLLHVGSRDSEQEGRRVARRSDVRRRLPFLRLRSCGIVT